MKSRPILFSGPMVRALLDGTKKQTRRVCKNKVYGNGEWNKSINDFICHNDYLPPSALLMDYRKGGYDLTTSNLEGWGEACPYGQPGDQLWVRETFAEEYSFCDHPEMPGAPTEHFHFAWHYRADGEPAKGDLEGFLSTWKPSIHMPRAASRITLEITGVRVERLQDISEDDAKAEGCERLHDDEPGYIHREDPDWKICPKCGGTRLHNAIGASGGVIFDVDCRECDSYLKRYHHLWESINGPASWDLNPWVWVVEFRRLS